jgi:signal transduction histidine kinase
MTTVPPTPRRLHRAPGSSVAGVAAGLAEHLRVDVRVVRAVFVALIFAGGFGALLYIAFWAVVPQSEAVGAAHRTTPSRRSAYSAAKDVNVLVPLAALLVGGLLLLQVLGIDVLGSRTLPLIAGGIGLAVVWREADEAQRRRLSALSQRTAQLTYGGRPVGALRVAAGTLLLLTGVVTGVASSTSWIVVGQAFLAAVVVVAGLLLIFGPWWWRLLQELTEERRERVRSQERVEVATHVHDSVLHTLTLIQRHVDDPREVARLARGQERELRRWLYRPDTPVDSAPMIAEALEDAAGEVEDLHAVPVDVVVVGDCPVDDRLAALVAAAREAMVNAAKHSGAASVSVYGEVEPEQVHVFVRDRGRGFDPAAVPGDRYGVAESIVGRMRRHGGEATIVTSPGAGAEVQLDMSRGAG